MVKPAAPQGPQSSQQTVGTGELPAPLSPAAPLLPGTPPVAGYIQEIRSAALPNLSSGGRPGTGSVLSTQRQVEAYRAVQTELDTASSRLSQFRRDQNPQTLAEAQSHFEQAQRSYQESFPTSEGSIMVRDGNVSTIYDIGGLNTRLNAVGLSLRRAEQVQRASQ